VTAFRPRFLLRERAFLERIAAFDRAPDPDFWPECLEALALHHETETAYFTTIYNNSNAQTDFKSFLARMDAAAGSTTSLLKLISGLGDVSHMDIQRDLLALRATALGAGVDSREFVRGVEAFLERHYYHADAELDLLCPRWGEQPERVRQLVFLTMAPGAAPADPAVTAQQQREEYLSEAGAVDARLRARPLCGARFRRRFRRQLARVRSYLRAREEMRDCSTRAYHVVRRYLLEAGRRLEARGVLASAGHVFFLQTEDLSELARTSGAPPPTARLAELSERLRVRRLMHSGYRDLTPPNEFGRGVTQRNGGNALAASEGSARLQGLGSSPGLAEGPVRVIVDLRDSGAIRPGDILVTKFTDPGWTPILGLVSGIVTEVGGLLSHAAVIGREYGIPAVLNLPGATEVLRSGMRVQVNGDTGFVTVLPPHSGVSQPQDLDGARDSTRAIEAADSEAPPAARLR
jgi:phosphohistidine swiveling domain-containing protein